MIAARNINKVYPGIVACRDVSLQIREGQIHALLGDNGAGKSTLIKIFGGVLQPSSGTIEVDGVPVRLKSPQHARELGIRVVHQFGALIDTLTAEENLRLAIRDPKAIRRILDSIGISRDRLVRSLTARERQLLSILRTRDGCRYLILDEPSSLLAPQEAALLFEDLRRMAAEGHGILVVSHKLPEVITHADRFTLMRDGEASSNFEREYFLGLFRRAVPMATAAAPKTNQKPLVKMQQLTAKPGIGEFGLESVDLEIHRGEVLGVAGHASSGARTLLRVLYGDSRSVTAGQIDRAPDAPPEAIGFVPERRSAEGVIGEFGIGENLVLRRRELMGLGEKRAHRHEFARRLIERFRIWPSDQNLPARALSGGNLQKLIIARECEFGRRLLLVANPTAGLDQASARFVREELRRHADSGAGVVVCSEDLEELVEICDRVVVFSKGRKSAELNAPLSAEAIGMKLSGLEPPARFVGNPV